MPSGEGGLTSDCPSAYRPLVLLDHMDKLLEMIDCCSVIRFLDQLRLNVILE